MGLNTYGILSYDVLIPSTNIIILLKIEENQAEKELRDHATKQHEQIGERETTLNRLEPTKKDHFFMVDYTRRSACPLALKK